MQMVLTDLGGNPANSWYVYNQLGRTEKFGVEYWEFTSLKCSSAMDTQSGHTTECIQNNY